MLGGSPQARAATALGILVFAGFMTMTSLSTQTSAQTAGGAVRVWPPLSSPIPTDRTGSVFVILEDLNHHGIVEYDDDRDGTFDRGVPSNGLAAFEFTLAFNHSVIAINDIKPGPGLNDSSRNFQCLPPDEDEPGIVSFACVSLGSQDGLQGSATLGMVELTPVAPGRSPLLLTASLAGPLGDQVPVAIKGGAVQVVAAGSTTLSPGSQTPGSAAQPESAATQQRGGPADGPPQGTAAAAATALADAQQTPSAVSVAQTAEDGGAPDQDSQPGSSDAAQAHNDRNGGIGLLPWMLLAAGTAAIGGLSAATLVWRRRNGE